MGPLNGTFEDEPAKFTNDTIYNNNNTTYAYAVVNAYLLTRVKFETSESSSHTVHSTRALDMNAMLSRIITFYKQCNDYHRVDTAILNKNWTFAISLLN